MLPHEVLKDESKIQQQNAASVYHINTTDLSSVSLRPHSRHVLPGPAGGGSKAHGSSIQPSRPNMSRGGAGGGGAPAVEAPSKRLGTSSTGARQGSPGRGRAAGNAMINPSTILTSSVTAAIADHNLQIARMQPSSPSRHRGASPQRAGGDATSAAAADAVTAPPPLLGPARATTSSSAQEDISAHPPNAASGSNAGEGFLTPNRKAGRSVIHHHLDNMAASALVGLVGMHDLRQYYRTTGDDTLPSDAAFHTANGSKIGELVTPSVISVDLKRLDLGVVVPTNSISTVRAPVCAVALSEYPQGILQVDVTDIDQTGCNNHPFRFDCVVKQVIGVPEIDMDRCLRYDVAVDLPAMFLEPPAIAADSGDLTFTVNPIATGKTFLTVTLIDCACVNVETGACETSPPIQLAIEVIRRKSLLAASKTHHGGASTNQGANVSSKIGTVPTFLHDTSNWNNANSTADGGRPNSPPTSPLGATGGGGVGSSTAAFSFPPSNAHTLRREEILRQHNEFVIQGTPSSATLLRQRSASFHSPMDLLELLRFATSVAEGDRIAGEAVDGNRQQFEQRLAEKIKEVEKAKGHASLELCPLLLRHAQVCIATRDPRRHGDTVECLDRICRIRAQNCQGLGGGVGDVADHHAGAAPELHFGVAGLSGSSGMGSSPGPRDHAKKHHEALLQSYMMAASYLKDLGRFREALEFAQHGARVADATFGDTSVEYLRISLLMGALSHLLGDRATAMKTLEISAGRAEVLLGKDGHATIVVLHLLGILHMYEGEFSKALQLHDKALFMRQHAPNVDPVLLAESLALSAYTRALCGINVSNRAKVNSALENALQLVNQAVPFSSSSGELHKCAVLTIIARVTALHGTSKDYESSIKLLQRSADIAAKLRGFQSVECAAFAMEVAAMQIVSGTSSATTTSELSLVHNAFLTALGPQHPFTCRAAVLTAELRMTQVPITCRDQALRALHFFRQQLLPTHRDIGITADVLGRIYAALRDSKQQLQYTRYAYDIATQRFTPSSTLKVLETRLIGSFSAARVAPPRSFFAALENRAATVRDDAGDSSVENIEPQQNLGEAMLLNGDYERAHHVFTKALKIADSVNFIFLLGHLFKPAAQLSINDLQERNRIAGDRINTALAFSFATILYQIAVVFESQGQSEDAQSTFLQALAALEISGLVVGDSVSEVIFSLAKLLYCEGHYGDALAYAEKGYNLVLDNASMRTAANVNDASSLMHVILQRLSESGYSLVRHHDSRHRFTSYV